jgi:hypothetical protein
MKMIAAAFVKAQKEFAPALKAKTNPHFKSQYVDLAGCVEAVIDALNTNGIALMQPTHECESGVLVETLFVHESGEMLSGGKLHVPAQKQDAQGYGSALTYARRYGLMAACGIAPEDDDGNAATKAGPPIKKDLSRKKEAAGVNMDDATIALKEAQNLDDLQRIFGDLYTAATPEQKTSLKTTYDAAKAAFAGE